MSGVVLSELQLDALGEIGNIGAGNAGTSLAKMINRMITLAVPDTLVVGLDQLSQVTEADLECPVMAVYVGFEGDATGCVLLLCSAQQVKTLLSLLDLAVQGSILDLPELHKSALSEIGNIITSAYLSAMGSFTQLHLMPMPPGVAVGMSGAILDTIGAYLGQFAEAAIVVQVRIYSSEVDLGLELLMIPHTNSLETILAALGLDEGGQESAD